MLIGGVPYPAGGKCGKCSEMRYSEFRMSVRCQEVWVKSTCIELGTESVECRFCLFKASTCLTKTAICYRSLTIRISVGKEMFTNEILAARRSLSEGHKGGRKRWEWLPARALPDISRRQDGHALRRAFCYLAGMCLFRVGSDVIAFDWRVIQNVPLSGKCFCCQ